MAELLTTVYLILEPSFMRGTDRVRGFNVAAVRKKRPAAGSVPGSVVLALKLTMPSSAFEPLRPEVSIKVPEGAYEIQPEVDVLVPEGGA